MTSSYNAPGNRRMCLRPYHPNASTTDARYIAIGILSSLVAATSQTPHISRHCDLILTTSGIVILAHLSYLMLNGVERAGIQDRGLFDYSIPPNAVMSCLYILAYLIVRTSLHYDANSSLVWSDCSVGPCLSTFLVHL